jgi:hypothetical protein
MSDRTRIRIAALVTALFLVAISAVGLATRADTPRPATPATAPAAAPQKTFDEPYEDDGHEGNEDRD